MSYEASGSEEGHLQDHRLTTRRSPTIDQEPKCQDPGPQSLWVFLPQMKGMQV